ncbi:MAG: glycine--tRNA ligase [Thermoplasmata archaeon]|nr:glycine--tRNA ligase [Euryarchaeota archaeon]RLF66079.1 MAG: glycine--tRNA ligase [Thermoplasmata archaeon]
MGDIYDEIMAIAKRRGIVYPSFDIYGGISGFYSYGPIGALLKDNIIDVWKKFYVVREGCLLIDTPNIVPYKILKASGHVDRFTDILVECKSCGSKYRADKVIEEQLSIDTSSIPREKIFKIIEEMELKCPSCGGKLGNPREVNLMFKTEIGFGDVVKAFLRPETAQGIFVEFNILYNVAKKKLPMGVAQIGRGFRNEISPRQGIIRLREFNMAEVEVFFDPKRDDHPLFNDVKDEEIKVITKDDKELQDTVGNLYSKGIIKGKLLAYYIGLTKKLLVALGIDEKKLRFRQHKLYELAHYATDCWDAEIYLERFGWTEVVGIANRSSYDLTTHSKESGVELVAYRNLEKPKKVVEKVVIPKYNILGPMFKDKLKAVERALKEGKYTDTGDKLVVDLETEKIEIPKSAVDIKKKEKTIMVEKFVPWVVEPSYGIDRILYGILEHSYTRDDRGYVYFRFRPYIAPIKVGVFPIVNKEPFTSVARDVYMRFVREGIVAYYDASDSIGKRYARMDEIGTPYCVTIDGQTLEDNTVTVRDRDTRKQIRMGIEKAVEFVKEKTTFKFS